MSGFYKLLDNEIICAPTFVNNKEYTLEIGLKDTYEYPIDGWYWFDTIEEAQVLKNDVNIVSRFQGMAALEQLGKLSAIQAYMDTPECPTFTKLAWDNITQFDKNSPLLNELAIYFDIDLDVAFDIARNITV